MTVPEAAVEKLAWLSLACRARDWVLTLCKIESVSEVWLEYGVEEAGFEMEAEGFAVKGTVILVRSTSVAEVVGWVSSEDVGRG